MFVLAMAEPEQIREYVLGRLAAVNASQAELSEAMGRERSFVSQWLSAQRRVRPSPTELKRAAEFLQCDLVKLLELVWDIPIDDLAREIGTMALQRGPGDDWRELLPEEREALRRIEAFHIAEFLRRRKAKSDSDTG
jgi:transcriptional regulator with XRE-family HTH domain